MWEILNMIDEGVNGEIRTLSQYFVFLFKTMDKTVDSFEWVAMDTYEFEKVTCASGISFFDSCAFHARSFYEEKFVTSSSPFIS